jgi:hypothetical protein
MRYLLGVFVLFTGATAAAGPPITTEPLVRPAKNAAFQKAQRTLQRAAELVRQEADGTDVEKIGFHAERFRLGGLQIRDPQVAYATGTTGRRVHVGYAMQVKIGDDHDGRWVPVLVGRHGRIANRLFAGSESVFAMARPELSEAVLSRVMERDLASKQPLDLVSRWTARRQAHLLDGKPFTMNPDKPITAAVDQQPAKAAE